MKTVMFMLMPLVSLGFCSCSVTYITVRKPLPPEIVPKKGTNKVAFVNFYDYSNDLNVAQKKEEAYLAVLNGLITIQPSMAKAAPVVSQLAVQVGEEYVKKFYPQTIDETRMLYKGKIFAQANHSFFINECGKAEELLQQLTQSPDKKIAGRAENNLLVVKEGCGRVVPAPGF